MGNLSGRGKKRRQEIFGSVDVDPEYQENIITKEAEGEAQGAQDLVISKNSKDSASFPLTV